MAPEPRIRRILAKLEQVWQQYFWFGMDMPVDEAQLRGKCGGAVHCRAACLSYLIPNQWRLQPDPLATQKPPAVWDEVDSGGSLCLGAIERRL